MGALQVDDHRLILGPLRFVNGQRIPEIQHIKILGIVICHPAISEIHADGAIISVSIDPCDIADVTIADVFMIPVLHDLIADTKQPASFGHFLLSRRGGIHFVPQRLIQRIDTRLCFLPERAEKYNIVHAVSADFL